MPAQRRCTDMGAGSKRDMRGEGASDFELCEVKNQDDAIAESCQAPIFFFAKAERSGEKVDMDAFELT